MNYHHSQFMNYQLQGHYYPPPPPIPPHVVAAFNEYYYNNYNDYHRDYHSLGYRKQGHRKQRKPRKLMRSLSTGSISPKVYHYYTLDKDEYEQASERAMKHRLRKRRSMIYEKLRRPIDPNEHLEDDGESMTENELLALKNSRINITICRSRNNKHNIPTSIPSTPSQSPAIPTAEEQEALSNMIGSLTVEDITPDTSATVTPDNVATSSTPDTTAVTAANTTATSTPDSNVTITADTTAIITPDTTTPDTICGSPSSSDYTLIKSAIKQKKKKWPFGFFFKKTKPEPEQSSSAPTTPSLSPYASGIAISPIQPQIQVGVWAYKIPPNLMTAPVVNATIWLRFDPENQKRINDLLAGQQPNSLVQLFDSRFCNGTIPMMVMPSLKTCYFSFFPGRFDCMAIEHFPV